MLPAGMLMYYDQMLVTRLKVLAYAWPMKPVACAMCGVVLAMRCIVHVLLLACGLCCVYAPEPLHTEAHVSPMHISPEHAPHAS